jgi:putative membrane protein
MKKIDDYLLLEDNVRHSYMGVVWSHKIQEKQADILTSKYHYLEIIRVFCTSLTSVGLISLIFTDEFWVKIIATGISFISTLISFLFKSFDTQKNILSHKKAANELLIIREQLRFLLLKIKLKKQDISELVNSYDDIIKRLGEIYKDAPNTTDQAVEKASEALNVKKDNEFSDIEVDANLPESLQRSEVKE